jgi:TonB-linked SusC/RagA family outer membrane protein
MKKIFFLISIMTSLQSAFSQMRITGTVLSSVDKLPLQGVTVSVKNTTRATTTDSKGTFSIWVDSSSALLFSHIGYTTQQLTAGNDQHLMVILQLSSALLSEVTVSTGYQDIPGQRTTGSFGKINNATLDRVVNTNIIAKLEGLTSGLYFSKANKKTELAVRGLSTLNAATEPLIVVDNFPYEGNMNDINPNDVESVTILKDAAAASIWGAKAGNGVIVITTKKASFNQQPRVTFNTNITVQQKPDLYYSPAFLNSSDFIDVEKFLFSKGFYNSALGNTTNRPVISPVVEILAKQKAGQLSAADADAIINSYRNYDFRNDMSHDLYQQAVKQQYALNFSGGSSFINYNFSLGYDKIKLNTVGDEQQRKTITTSVNIKPFSKLEIGGGVMYTMNDNASNSLPALTPGSGKSAYYPYARLADENGNPLPLEQSFRMSYTDTAGAGRLLDWKFWPLDELRLRDFTTSSGHLLLRLSAKYSFTTSLNAEIRYVYETSAEEKHNYTPVGSFYARNLVNEFSQRSGNTVKRNLPYGGYLDQFWNNLSSSSLRGQLNYAASFNEQHSISAIMGAEIRNTKSSTQSGRTYGYDNNLTTYANVDALTNFTYWDNLGQSSIPSITSFGEETDRFVSFYSNASYTFRSRYTATASARRDASNIFGVNTNNKWQPLWSAGLAWNLSSESFYNLPWLPLLKLRTSYGYSGNVVPLSALTTINYNSNPNSLTNLTYASVFNPPNPDLHWEKTGMINFGLDLASKNNRIKTSIDYYRKASTGLLAPDLVDPTVGVSSMTKNTADLLGHGIDLDIQATIINSKLVWQVQQIFSWVTNKVTRYYAPAQTPFTLLTDGYSINPIPGRAPYSLVSYKWAGLDPSTGDPMAYYLGQPSKDYPYIAAKATLADLVFHGTTRPAFFGNCINTFSFQKFTLTANIAYKFHYWCRRQVLSYNAMFNQWVTNKEFSQRWQKPGDEQFTNVPSMVYPANTNRDRIYTFSSASVEKGDLIRLQDLALSYTFGKVRVAKAIINSLQLYAFATNGPLLWVANKKGLDPDYGTSTPPSVSISFGLKTTF